MSDDDAVLWWWTAIELTALIGVGALVALSLTGEPTAVSYVARELRIAALAVIAVELLIPAVVYLDLRRRTDANTFWVHVAAMPGINLFGLVAYLVDQEATTAA